MPKTITQLPPAAVVSSNAVVAADNSSGTVTEKITLGQIVSLAGNSFDQSLNTTDSVIFNSGFFSSGLLAPTQIYNLGAVSGSGVSINYGIDKQIQKLSLNGTATQFVLGSGWPASLSADVLLEITSSSSTTITWSVVTDWYNQPGVFSSGTYLVLLRSMGSSVIQGHYIGYKTN